MSTVTLKICELLIRQISIVVDTRNYDRSITDLGWNQDYIPLISNDAGRTLMGSHQERWFYRQLSESSSRGAAYRIVANQIVFSRLIRSGELNGDSWDVSLSFFFFSPALPNRS